MTNELVSIIVPVYNVEKYICKCLDSILLQDYEPIEVIVVDDGSTDESGIICDRYDRNWKNIRVIHQKNQGVSQARNIGLEYTNGKYICFVDSDDWIPKDSITKLMRFMQKKSADMCIGAFESIAPVRNWVCDDVPENITYIDKTDTITFLNIFKNHNFGPCRRIYRKSIIVENNIFFPEGVKLGEDAVFVMKYLKHCKIIVTIPDVVYYYNKLIPRTASERYYDEVPEWYLMMAKVWENMLNLGHSNRKVSDSVVQSKYLSCWFEAMTRYINEKGYQYDEDVIFMIANLFAPYIDENICGDCEYSDLYFSCIRKENIKNVIGFVNKHMKTRPSSLGKKIIVGIFRRIRMTFVYKLDILSWFR